MCGGAELAEQLLLSCKRPDDQLIDVLQQEDDIIELGPQSNPNPNPNPNSNSNPNPNSMIIASSCSIFPIRQFNLPPATAAACISPINGRAVGLAIVAAIQAELDQSPPATSRPISISPSIPISNVSISRPSTSPAMPCSKNQNQKKLSLHNRTKPCSIFSTALSPPAAPANSSTCTNSDFLRVCFFCKHPLLLSKDIFMYRGDRAFCSTECRYQQIVMDEHRDIQPAKACKGQEYQTSIPNKHKQKIISAIG